MCVHVLACVSLCVCVFRSLCVVPVRACVGMCWHVRACVFVFWGVCVRCLCVHVWACVFVWAYVFVCLWVRVCMSLCMVHIRAYGCMHVRVFWNRAQSRPNSDLMIKIAVIENCEPASPSSRKLSVGAGHFNSFVGQLCDTRYSLVLDIVYLTMGAVYLTRGANTRHSLFDQGG